jgi:hypothetical protein
LTLASREVTGTVMHARVVTVQAKPGSIEQVIDIFQNHVVPAARNEKGFGGGRVLASRETGKLLLITLWATVADLQSNEASGFFREQLGKFMPHLAVPPVRETYELSVNVNP